MKKIFLLFIVALVLAISFVCIAKYERRVKGAEIDADKDSIAEIGDFEDLWDGGGKKN